MKQPAISWLDGPGGSRLACRKRDGSAPTLLFLSGYASDMEGAKALALERHAAKRGLAMVRFDYSGTGCSEGVFEEGTLEGWLGDSLAVIDRLTQGPLILVGSSMGAWIALHAALRRPDRVRALIGVAAAPDFTDWGPSDADKQALQRDGMLVHPDPQGGRGQVTSLAFWRSGQELLLLGGPIAIDCPVRLIHGEKDREVPLSVPLRLLDRLRSADVQLTIVKGGGHRLSEPHEIATILRTLDSLLEPAR